MKTTCELHGWDASRSSFDFCPTCRYRERQARAEEDFEDLTRMLPSRQHAPKRVRWKAEPFAPHVPDRDR
jgi:hypothetical protein